MDSDLSTLLMTAQTTTMRTSVATEVMRRAHESDQQVLDLIEAGAQNLKQVAPLPDGVGQVVDKTA
jgi:hypothetical protein